MKYNMRDVCERIGVYPIPDRIVVNIGIHESSIEFTRGDVTRRRELVIDPRTIGAAICEALGVETSLTAGIVITAAKDEIAKVLVDQVVESNNDNGDVFDIIGKCLGRELVPA